MYKHLFEWEITKNVKALWNEKKVLTTVTLKIVIKQAYNIIITTSQYKGLSKIHEIEKELVLKQQFGNLSYYCIYTV